MGSVANRIAKKVVSAGRSKVIDMDLWRDARDMLAQEGFDGDGPIPEKFADLHPCHAVYVMAQNLASILSESISVMKEADGYVRIVGDAYDEYLPYGPPASPTES